MRASSRAVLLALVAAACDGGEALLPDGGGRDDAGLPDAPAVACWHAAILHGAGTRPILAVDRHGALRLAVHAGPGVRLGSDETGCWTTREVVAAGRLVGFAVAGDGMEHLAWIDRGALWYGSSASAFAPQMLDPGPWPADDPAPGALVVDRTGHVHVVYGLGPRLRRASWTGRAWGYQRIDAGDGLARVTGVAAAAADALHVAWSSARRGGCARPDLFCGESRLAHATNARGAWVIDELAWDSGEWLAVFADPSLALGLDGTVHVAYAEIGNGGLCPSAIRHVRGGPGREWTSEVVDRDAGCATTPSPQGRFGSPSLAVDGHGVLHLAYDRVPDDGSAPPAVSYAAAVGAGWTRSRVGAGRDPWVAVGSDGSPRVAYWAERAGPALVTDVYVAAPGCGVQPVPVP